uniref:hypothetical protein n=1 Tax=Acidithiobacillus ferridurans TaxID=1232575 RepID=UPI001D011FDA|nr:hypothetical protein [Acidithiobacillus ferridurans]
MAMASVTHLLRCAFGVMSALSLIGDLAEGVFVLGEIFLLKRLDSSFFGYHRESRRIGRLKKFNRKSVEKQT